MRPSAANIGAALLTIAIVGLAGPASAHVSVSSTEAAPGGYGKIVFRVPNESATASTTRFVITLPRATPFSVVTPGVLPGWKATIAKKELDRPTKVGNATITEAVSTVTWTATGDGIPPSQFDEFALSVGPFPEADKVSFSATQTYSDGEVAQWDEIQKGSQEPEHPAPTLGLNAAGSTGHDAVSTDAEDAVHAPDKGNDAATWLSAVALLVAAAALVVALRDNRRRA
jgi:uncharacterized protein YcnI